MAYKTILVQVDQSKACAARIEYAATIATDHAAHLTGFHLSPAPIDTTPYLVGEGYSGRLEVPIKEEVERREQEAEALRESFEQSARRAGASELEWRSVEGDPVSITALHARYGDLLILGQHSDESDPALDIDFPASVAIKAGRPVLVVPYISGVTSTPKHIMVAWNASREATRAVADALPFLQKAERVEIVVANPDQLPVLDGQETGAALALYLARHGVNVETAQTAARDIDVGNILLSRAADFGTDMLVMGAYGHSPLREKVLGGVTRELLKHMTLPVLMAH